MTSFKALRVHVHDRSTQARFEDLQVGELSAGNVLVRVCWSGINYKDALAVTGKGRIIKSFPRVPGVDLAGIVERSEDIRYKPGDRVLVTGCGIGESLDGGYAEFARLPASILVPLPANLTMREAMAIGTAGFTAAFALRRLLDNHQTPELGPIAVTGPTGGVGSYAIDLFKRKGFAVHAISGKAEACGAYLRALGADEVISRQGLTLGTRPLESMLWGGAVDNLGGEMLGWLLRTTRSFGNVACIGLAASAELPATVMPFILRGVSLIGLHSVECPRPWREALWASLNDDWKPRHIERIAAQEIVLDDLPAACDALIAGSVQGRMLVRIAGG
ncbi:MAG TPA: acryloyl-CoA reductase [Fontimonas sp.]